MKKRGSKAKKFMAIDTLVLVLISVVLGAFGQVFMKMGLKDNPISLSQLFSTKLLSTIFQKYVFIGVVLYLVAVLIWFVVLSTAELSFAYPLISLAYIITALLAVVFFKENVSLIRWAGILLILGGVFFVTRS